MQSLKKYIRSLCIFNFAFFITSCSIQNQIKRQAQVSLIGIPSLSSAHIGISLYNLETKQYLYNYNGDKYFIPASNVKLFTLYAGLKFLADSLVAARVTLDNGIALVQATGDPTFLHPDFINQPLLDFLLQPSIESIKIYTPFATTSLGYGWAWDDFAEKYSAERDPFPMYGNLATVIYDYDGDSIRTVPPSLKPFVIGKPEPEKKWALTRDFGGHLYTIDTSKGDTENEKKVTLSTGKGIFAARYLADALHKPVEAEYYPFENGSGVPVYSQPKDSLFKIMMQRSDNFFAEQTLLMVANEHIGEMNEKTIIDTLLFYQLKDIPQKPKWVDGSGLSRNNLFTPQDFVWILDKLKNEYGLERMKVILPTANEGSLKGMLADYKGSVFAKTGSMSNVNALSGYLITKKNKLLEFSIILNHQQASAALVKKQMEIFLTGIIEHY